MRRAMRACGFRCGPACVRSMSRRPQRWCSARHCGKPRDSPHEHFRLTEAVGDGQKARTRAWFEELQSLICASFEAIEAEYAGPLAHLPPGRFETKAWRRSDSEDLGGGIMRVMKGRVFEKVGVNVSTVYGTFSPDFARQIPGAEDDSTFLVERHLTHRPSALTPHVPAVHMNTRYIVTTKSWFGGAPLYHPDVPQRRGCARFPRRPSPALAATRMAPITMRASKQWCDEYFFLPHRGEARGAGGIFYDQLGSDWEADFAFAAPSGSLSLRSIPTL